MKKVYSVMLLLFCLWVPFAKAQLIPCPGATAIPVIGPSSCRVLVFEMPPNAQLLVVNAAGQNIGILPLQVTDSLGRGSVFYNCNSSPAQVVALTATGTCFATVAQPIGLPIKVKNLTGRLQNDNSVILRWISVFESNSYEYVIQKSADGRSFNDIGNLEAAGTSLQTINYSFVDKQGANGGVFYRLKLVDLDGSSDYTKIVYINNSKGTSGALSVFPNPFRSEVQLKGISSSDVTRKNVQVYDVMGKEVAYRVVGGNAIYMDPSLPKGVYILRAKGQSFKLFKE